MKKKLSMVDQVGHTQWKYASMYCEISTLLHSNVCVLTANQRIAMQLTKDYNQQQQHKNLATWPSANILPLTSWLTQQWQQNTAVEALLLDAHEELLVWESIIADEKLESYLLATTETAKLAKQAWQTLMLWEVNLEYLQADGNIEIETFLRWSQTFANTLTNKKWLTQSQLSTAVCELIEQKQIHCPQKIILVGYDDLPPALLTLIEALKKHCKVIFFQAESINLQQRRVSACDKEQEIIAMATWAKQQLEDDPNSKRIGCVVPNLDQERHTIARIFGDVFAPDNRIPGQAQQTLAFNLSAGQPFSQIEMIQAALNALALALPRLNLERVSAFLLTPFINSKDQERCLAAEVDIALKHTNKVAFTPALIQMYLSQLSEKNYHNTTLAQRWSLFCNINPGSAKRNFHHWANLFQQQLQALDWPGQRNLTSEEFQVVSRWHQVLQSFSKLDRLFPAVTWSEALKILNELCKNVIFQPQSTQDHPIQILGMLEAASYQFDDLWIMGLDDENWPPKANPNPFLPMNLQREKAMPHASAARELIFSQQIQQRLIASATRVTVSSAEKEHDKLLRPSRLILAIRPSENSLSTSTKAHTAALLEQLENSLGPQVADNENIRGGSWILQQQALCPFRAFANVRLQANAVEKPSIGLDAKTRGILTHQALDIVWKQIKSQQQLLALSQLELETTVTAAIDETLHCVNVEKSYYLDVEARRLQKLLLAWLSLEKERPSFRVQERETKRHITIGKLEMQIQIDRIDTLENGSQLIIDYKTSAKNNPYDWLGERPRQPQLPIYAIFGSDDSHGMAYAEVNRSSLQFKGIINNEEPFSKVYTMEKFYGNELDWQSLKDEMQKFLEALSDDFMQGHAEIDPQDPQACLTCHLQSLCRIAG